ncbi:type III secretion system chaperone [Salmonella enterica]|uniref:type III secretion system chaperone n=1 Tax=Salmonella enterica TaxID=28901 RepID=UPI001D32EC7F|nr:type III secretion system chaperone [Salmonella enterica subsp. enterica serovar Oranienburg]
MMMYTERANLLLSELSQYLDGEYPVLDESNYAFIWLSDMLFSFTLAGEDEGEKRDILCVAHICPFPYCDDGTAYDLLLRLLHDNHAWSNTGGGVLGIDEQTGFVCLCLQVDMFSLEQNEFAGRIACIYRIAQAWKARLMDVQAGEEDACPEAGRMIWRA